MEVQSPSVKRHYDITMSRRTRKQSFQVQQITNNEKPISKCETNTTRKDHVSNETKHLPIKVVKESEHENDHKSLKQLIVGEEKDVSMNGEGKEKGRNSSSLGEHFTEEEKQLQLVRMQQKEGLKFKKLVSRYAKVLGHLMKSKRDPHLSDAGKKPFFKLST